MKTVVEKSNAAAESEDLPPDNHARRRSRFNQHVDRSVQVGDPGFVLQRYKHSALTTSWSMAYQCKVDDLSTSHYTLAYQLGADVPIATT
ncbi:hypothetical protein BFN67_09110 [Pseudaminobacter manganicus]|uniref:Uncharacterized protein n=1 Tax=Manganibacter manganicus TaxID=1873176 RepID=A0A1V8RJQ2_9HYPH|nr:hypothetical protein BFN67_09110 [Pseudaminobacter manganicus]